MALRLNITFKNTALKFSNSYYDLGEAFYQQDKPTQVSAPQLILWNNDISQLLAIPQSMQDDTVLLAKIFSGNQIMAGSEPIALAYSGHQFGHFNAYLGDGRAHLLGEVLSKDEQRFDIQLKGSGQTAYSRQGDGRCAFGPAVREYLMSEAMQALGVPTSRCLAVVTTGENVYRETEKPGAVVTRVAASHIRVGTFQYFAARGDLTSLKTLTDYAIERHFSEIDLNSENKVIEFLQAAIAKQIKLVVEWLRIGFIHGVMNTDNTAISGETIDFGPCAMMGIYHPEAVHSSIDKQGRYAFSNQARIAQWNMARLAECLLMLLQEDNEHECDDEDKQEEQDDASLKSVEQIIMQFTPQFEQAYQTMMARKLGFSLTNEKLAVEAQDLVTELLALMEQEQLDYTQTFNQLTLSLSDNEITKELNESLQDWSQKWRIALDKIGASIAATQQLMRQSNPVVIPRNHHVEKLLADSEKSRDMTKINEFIAVIRSPYQAIAATASYQDLPVDGDKSYRTFCGT